MSVATKDQVDKSVSELAKSAALKKSSVGGEAAAAAVVKASSGCNAKSLSATETSTPQRGRRTREEWDIGISSFARLTINPIRCIVEGLKLDPNPDKCFIALSLGDPTTFGNFNVSSFIVDAVRESLDSYKWNGYGPSAGHMDARKAVAEYVSPHQGPVTPNDVILTSGCSSALDICLTALGSAGDNILCPRPGFSIYNTLAEGMGIEIRHYDLIPELNWEVDLEQMESLIDDRTAAILITNPSNPCSSVFSREHLLRILDIAERHKLPIIADEIYEKMVFPGVEYHSISSLSENVPILSCGGLTKRFLVPGWRIGWIVVHDRNNVLKTVRYGLGNISGRILSCNTVVQGALCKILKETPQEFFDDTVRDLKHHAEVAFDILKDVPGLRPIMPEGAMYMMVGIAMDHFPEFADEMEFLEQLVREQSVFCLPGKCFQIRNYFRIVITVPADKIREACLRIAEFCDRHYCDPRNGITNGH